VQQADRGVEELGGGSAVAGEPEAKKLAEDEAKALGKWRKGVQKAPKGPKPFQERGDETPEARQKRYDRWRKAAEKTELGRLQGLARRAEFLWSLVAIRLELSERAVARRVDVWGADWLEQSSEAEDKQKVLDDLTRAGTPYWRLKTVMDAWCALWFWPLDKVGELDGTEPEYAAQGAAASARATERPGPVPLRDFADWLDFLEGVLGKVDMPESSLLSGIENLTPDEALNRLSDVEDSLPGFLGMRPAVLLPFRYPWMNTVEDIAGTTEKDIKAEDGHGFFHWELHFAHVFRGPGGGFDLQVGNPPWVRPDWNESVALAEFEPWFQLTERLSATARRERKSAILKSAAHRTAYLRDLTATTGTAELLGSAVSYPLISGTRPNLYRAFMCRTWAHLADQGTVGLVHPDSHFSGDEEGRLREAAYTRLRLHGDFVNSGNRFFPPPVGRSSHFGVHIYGQEGEIGFDHLSWLFSVDALRLSEDDDGTAPDPGVRYGTGWDERPHKKRIVRVDEATLTQWKKLVGDETQPVRQARLLSPVSTAEADAIEALAAYPVRLAGWDPQITSGYNEKTSKDDDLIDYNKPDDSGVARRPAGWSEVILKGPQIGLANPMFKQPSQGGGEVLGLNPMTLPNDAVPESEYVYVAEPEVYRAAQDVWSDGRTLDQLKASEREVTRARNAAAGHFGVAASDVTDEQVKAELLRRLRRPYTEFYRVAWREMIAPDTERSLYVALVPPGAAHVDLVHSATLGSTRLTALTAGFWTGLPVDYLLRTTGVGHLKKAPARRMPAPQLEHPLVSALLLRTLRLNCLTTAYADLWEELYDPQWPAYEPWACDWPELQPLHAVGPTWTRSTPLRTERARRAALVEIDALVAVWLGVSADALIAMYKSRFPIMQDFDAVTWFDLNERKIAGNRYTYGFGQTKDHYEHFLAFQKKERHEPPEGYTAPFYKANREKEMREAHAQFSARLQEAVDNGKWTPPAR
jgi:hypothetical protein